MADDSMVMAEDSPAMARSGQSRPGEETTPGPCWDSIDKARWAGSGRRSALRPGRRRHGPSHAVPGPPERLP